MFHTPTRHVLVHYNTLPDQGMKAQRGWQDARTDYFDADLELRLFVPYRSHRLAWLALLVERGKGDHLALWLATAKALSSSDVFLDPF